MLSIKILRNKMIKVYNVGQGDSLLFNPNFCVFQDNPILIDCGLSKANVYQKISESISSVLITHSDNDHIGGLEKIIKYKPITDVYIPYYLTEIQSIENYLRKKIHKRSNPLPLSAMQHINFHLLKDGDKLCGHMMILNPPQQANDFFGDWLQQNDSLNIEFTLQGLNELGFELPVDDIINYTSPLLDKELQLNDEFFNVNEYRNESKKFVHSFFISLYIRITRSSLFLIDLHTKSHVLLTANQASIVFKYNHRHENTSCLFTGDADVSVFERIIAKYGEPILETDILKMPHHGSQENMTERILKIMHPKSVIISHNNKYGHPSCKVMYWLNKLNIDVYYTNDVIKKMVVLESKTTGLCASGNVEFI